MEQERLSDLRERLKESDWKSSAKLPARTDARPSGKCNASRGRGPFHLEFESFDKGEPAKIEQGFGVRVRELKQTSIYLYRKRNEDAWVASSVSC